ncbi:low molecular weight protein-tyrosine-phosphatase [Altericroceibacterium endophyticum]|uniref:protein-tyrosine-phosphatase n=1 Tax=Altericroceibacterium endophyticum TaxID=1808508 RepID=A0A6I4T2Z2_9SPHN|nr:low molecular weight protein-tyrosine-phosphatase [Altericroceibacterium endophyticum]MXO64483.1 low molecular weight phosphotyrosine protein phosphatase [Altericroceibacterium endophyticum]
MTQTTVLFVCLGNICRSPLAEGAMREAAERAGLDIKVDSCGTGNWHIGEAPDIRARSIARRKGVDLDMLRGRQLAAEDYTRFDYIFALDHDNLEVIRDRCPADSTAEISLLMDVVPGHEGEPVADPYFGGDEGFEVTWSDVSKAANALVERFSKNP